MSQAELIYRSIGVIHTEHREDDKTPIQPVYAKGCKGQVELFPEFLDGLRDLGEFSHIYLIYHFHRVQQVKLIIKPYLISLPSACIVAPS